MAKRLVYAEDVKEQIDEWLEVVGTVYVGKELSYYGELLECIEDAPTAERWIPCCEQIPKQGEQIIGTFDNGNGHVIVMQEQFWMPLLEGQYPLIAWMPLPKPYNGN